MGKRQILAISCTIMLILLISGCYQYVPPSEKPAQDTQASEDTSSTDSTAEIISSKPKKTEADNTKTTETGTSDVTSDTEGSQETKTDTIYVQPVPETKAFKPAEPTTLNTTEKDTCRCSFTWDPICSTDGKTYINHCLFKCFGRTEEELESSNQCPKKNDGVYTDDIKIEYDEKKAYGGYCWRQMWRSEDVRECRNIIVNGRLDDAPAPAGGNWLNQQHLVSDLFGTKDSYSIKLATGMQATNEEYNTTYQPLFEKGRYMLSFWARQDVAANNDWKVTLTLRDWWDYAPRPTGVKGCYEISREIDADEVYIEVKPNEWRHYHFEFDVPLKLGDWTSYMRESPECEYSWDMVPHGYGIEVLGPTVGDAYFDDFSLVKVE
ncbi:hypothetical protein KY363_00905 [Candidatus Woesearchaeota archaeon]|nr:hypothetical protein [Candidatus Woesearchaeota archaeon]